jgi:hypothetical protein
MKFPRFSLASIAFAILILAADFAVVRITFFGDDTVVWAIPALFLLPMFDTLLIGLYRLRRREHRTAGAIRFLLAGGIATVVVFALCVFAPQTMYGVLGAVGHPIAMASVNTLTGLFGDAVMRGWFMQMAIGISFEVLFPSAFLCLPAVLAALVVGHLARRIGTRERFGNARCEGSCENLELPESTLHRTWASATVSGTTALICGGSGGSA